jgi:peptidyl-prolyl cis-trans isomerase D
MLKTMRKNLQSLKSILWIVVATFIVSIFVVWGGAGRLGEREQADTIASVGGTRIAISAYTQALRNRIESMKSEFKEINRSFIEQLNLPQQVLEGMIEQTLLFEFANDLGLRASDEEVAEKIKSFPGLQQDGTFIGFDRYKRVLAMNRIPLSDFENSLRKDIILNKAIQVLTAGIAVTPEEVWESYQKSKETAKIEYLALEKSKITLDKSPAPAEVQAYFESHKDAFKMPEKREGALVFIKNNDLKKEVELSESEIEKYYNDNKAQFQVPEKIQVSRIFLPFAGRDKALVEAEAKAVLDKIRAGEDFAALAKEHSKDDKAQSGGDWGEYDWRTLSPKEQEAISKLEAGKISDLIVLDDGLAVLKVTAKETAKTTPYAEAKTRIRTILIDQRASALAADRISRLSKDVKKSMGLESAAQKAGLKVQTTGLLKAGQAFEDFDPSGAVSEALFKIKENEITEPIYTYGGVGLAQLKKIEAPRPAAFDEVKTDVEKDVAEAKKKEKALETIREARAKLTDNNWDDIAQKYKLEIKTVDAHRKEQYIAIIGESPEVDRLAFSLPLKQTSEPVEFENGYALVRVLDRKTATKEEFAKEKETEMNNLLQQEKNKFLTSYLAKLRTSKGVKIKYDAYVQVTSDILSRYETEK